METENNKIQKLYFGSFVGRTLKIFLSYYSKTDKELAGRIKGELEKYGIEVFVAHDDMIPAMDFPDLIKENIKSCNAFAPLLTSSFRESEWTDQEIGMACMQDRIIIPLQVDITPYGFIEHTHAFKIKPDNLHECCKDLIASLAKHEKLKDMIKDPLIKGLVHSPSFATAKTIIEALNDFDFNKEQINEIIRGSSVNQDVYMCWAAKPILHAWLEKYDQQIDPLFKENLIKQLK